jgi:hypothetical protein
MGRSKCDYVTRKYLVRAYSIIWVALQRFLLTAGEKYKNYVW